MTEFIKFVNFQSRGIDKLVENRKKERIEKLRQKLSLQQNECSKCGNALPHESPDEEPKIIDGKPVCDKCWYQALGNEIEKYPILNPKRKRLETRRKPRCPICIDCVKAKH